MDEKRLDKATELIEEKPRAALNYILLLGIIILGSAVAYLFFDGKSEARKIQNKFDLHLILDAKKDSIKDANFEAFRQDQFAQRLGEKDRALKENASTFSDLKATINTLQDQLSQANKRADKNANRSTVITEKAKTL